MALERRQQIAPKDFLMRATTDLRYLGIVAAAGLVLAGCGTGGSKSTSTPAEDREEPGIVLPPTVRRAGGRELKEFEDGSVVVADSGCLACHRIGEQGNTGPGRDLTHVGSQLSERQLEHAIVDAPKPMPSFSHLPQAKLEAIIRFLSLLR